jgi:hypothetical protein
MWAQTDCREYRIKGIHSQSRKEMCRQCIKASSDGGRIREEISRLGPFTQDFTGCRNYLSEKPRSSLYGSGK